MVSARRQYWVDLAEWKQEQEIGQQLVVLKAKLAAEAEERARIEAANTAALESMRADMERLRERASEEGADGDSGGASTALPANHIVVDQALIDESSRMLEYLRRDNAKLRAKNIELQNRLAEAESATGAGHPNWRRYQVVGVSEVEETSPLCGFTSPCSSQ